MILSTPEGYLLVEATWEGSGGMCSCDFMPGGFFACLPPDAIPSVATHVCATTLPSSPARLSLSIHSAPFGS
jgi:hypothetical protein